MVTASRRSGLQNAKALLAGRARLKPRPRVDPAHVRMRMSTSTGVFASSVHVLRCARYTEPPSAQPVRVDVQSSAAPHARASRPNAARNGTAVAATHAHTRAHSRVVFPTLKLDIDAAMRCWDGYKE